MTMSSNNGTGSQMSLSELLQEKLNRLKPTVTKVTKVDGSVAFYKGFQLEDNQTQLNSDGCVGPSYGFVIDTKPDMTVGHVAPWLLISSQDVPADPISVQSLGVTHILSLLPEFELPTGAKYETMKHFCLEIYDEEAFVLDSDFLQPALDFVTEAKVTGGRVLIHCNAGVSRAPSFVIFYLVKLEGIAFTSAWEIVKAARPVAKPNLGFWNQLKSLK